MNRDDFLYLFFLFFSMAFGPYYRKLNDVNVKKNVGSVVGLFIITCVSGWHIMHIFITILINCYIILFINKKICHIASFIFSFLYLTFFRTTIYFGLPYPPAHTNLIQMILTLKLVGLAFEVNIESSKNKNNGEMKYEKDFDFTFQDIFYYSLNYIGILTGPYYKYKTYYDHLHKPYNKYDKYQTAAWQRFFPLIPLFATIYLITDYLWPLSYVTTVDFENRSFFYRYWYIWPTFLNFRMRIYIGLILSECVCIMGGLGVYPTFCKNQSGNGPSLESKDKLNIVCLNEMSLKNTSYDYETVRTINPYATEFYPTLRDGMRNWNITVQYWLAMCIYKRFPSKKYRTFATMFVSGVWHGVYSGYYISVGMIPFGLIVEDIWVKVLLDDEYFAPKIIGQGIMLFFKMQFFSYAALAFSLLDIRKIFYYYQSVYHWLIPFYILLYFLGKRLLKYKNTKLPKLS